MSILRTNANFMKEARKGNEQFLTGAFRDNGARKYNVYSDEKGDTSLHAVAQGGLDRVASTMIEAGAVVNVRNLAGETPLYTAVRYGKIDVVKVLLAAGADPNIATKNGALPLDVAAQNSSSAAIAKALLGAKADPNNPNQPLIQAAQYNQETALAILAAGAKADIHAGDYRTPLHYAAETGKRDLMEALVAAGAEVDARSAAGETPLVRAVVRGQFISVEFLLAHGASPTLEDNSGKSPLTYAENGKNEQMIKILTAARDRQEMQITAKAPVAVRPAAPAAPAEPTPPAADDKHPDIGNERWMLLSETKAAHVGTYPEINRKITEIFNFASRERLVITENLKTGAETTTPAEGFDRLSAEAVTAATEALAQLRGAEPKKSFSL